MGRRKIEWAKSFMPVLNELEKEYSKTKPFKGLSITVSVHLEAKTANLALLLAAGGADVHVTGSNPLSTKDDICAGLSTLGVNVWAWHNCTPEEYKEHHTAALSCHPHLILDDGGDLTDILHGSCREFSDRLIGATEETTTGVMLHKQRAAKGQLNFPVIAVNDADMKHLFDNRYGTGESVWDGIMQTTNIQISGKTVVVAGYGWCGRGVAMRAAGLGANVIVTEIDPVKAIEAVMDGFRVMKMDDAAPLGDFFCTITGCKGVIVDRHFAKMKNNAFLSNAGHFDCEVDVAWLRNNSKERIMRRPQIEGYVQADGRILNVLCEGRLVNLAGGNGHPVEIMDMSFGVQALALEYLAKHGTKLEKGVYDVEPEIDARVSAIKLSACNIGLDVLTEEQHKYLFG
ncbi:MAG: adenosylhomocysteinase [Oscillospiraceae bacterium]|nr:adenosylhomocysteinase [Oscillospiraceae bacterium]